MKKYSTRVLSVLLSIIMVLSVFTIIPFTASADGAEETVETPVPYSYDKPSADNTTAIADAETLAILQANALANSARRGNGETADKTNNGSANYAFNNNTGSRWISGASTTQYGNSFGVTEAQFLDGEKIWIQSGFGTDSDDSRLIGGIHYSGSRDAGDPNINYAIINEYEVYASYEPAATYEEGTGIARSQTSYSEITKKGTLVAKGTMTGEPSGEFEEDIYFYFPVKANYITLVAINQKAADGSADADHGQVGASRIQFLEYDANIDRGLEAYWTFDDEEYDAAPTQPIVYNVLNHDENSGTLYGPTAINSTISGVQALSGNMLQLAPTNNQYGRSSRMHVGNIVDQSGDFAVSLWFNPTSLESKTDTTTNANNATIDKKIILEYGHFDTVNESNCTGYSLLYYDTTDEKLYTGLGDTPQSFEGVQLSVGEWYHLVVSVVCGESGTYTVTLYVNADRYDVEEISVEIPQNYTDLTFGSKNEKKVKYAEGYMDEIRYYDRDIGQFEVDALYAQFASEEETPEESVTISVQPGAGAKSATAIVAVDGEPIESENGVYKLTESAEITLTSTAFDSGFGFAGWRKWREGDEENVETLDGVGEKNGEYTYEFSEDDIGQTIIIRAEYNGFNYGNDETAVRRASASDSGFTLDEKDIYVPFNNFDTEGILATNASSNIVSGTGNVRLAFDKSYNNPNDNVYWSFGSGTPSKPYPYIQSGFGNDEDDAKLIGGVGYIAGSGTSVGGITNMITTFEIYVSNDEEFTNPVKVYDGDFTQMTPTIINGAKGGWYPSYREFFVEFEKPYAANYVRLVATGIKGNATVTEMIFYEFRGAQAGVPVELEFSSEVDVETAEDDEDPSITIDVPVHIVAENNTAKDRLTPDQHVVEIEDFTQTAVRNAFLEQVDGMFDSLKYDYTLDETAAVKESDDKWTLPVTRSAATYDLTYNLGDGQESKTIRDVEYGNLFVCNDDEDADALGDYNLVYAPGAKYWQELDTGAIVCTDAHFTLRATQDMTVHAVYDGELDTTNYKPYISEPVVSVAAYDDKTASKWKVELPITLTNAVADGSLNEDVEEFGIAIYKGGEPKPDAETIKGLLNGDKANLTTQAAYDSSKASGDVPLNNKGRYLHTFTTSSAATFKYIYAYIRVNGVYYVSNGQPLRFPGYVSTTD